MPDPLDPLIWRGAWASGTSYSIGDAVSVGATVYVALSAHTASQNNAPPNATFWELAASAAVTDAYATAADYKSFVVKSQAANDTEIERDLQAASRFIERYLKGQFFTKDTADVVRTFRAPMARGKFREDWAESENPWRYGPRTRVLDIDNLVSVTSITVDQNFNNTYSLTLTPDDYELLPLNADKGPEVKPYNQVRLTEYGSVISWPSGARVRITGIWGWPNVPEAIRLACIKFTAIMRNEGPDATGRIMELDQVVEQSDEGRRLAYSLMRSYDNRVTL